MLPKQLQLTEIFFTFVPQHFLIKPCLSCTLISKLTPNQSLYMHHQCMYFHTRDQMESYRGNRVDLVAVISPDFCAQADIRLVFARKTLAITDGNFEVTDGNANTVFKVVDKLWSLHDRHVLFDSAGAPVVTFKKKNLSAYKKWQAFKGDSSDSSDLLFSVRKASLVQFKTELDVFLSGKEEHGSCDFKVVGSWFERSCIIHDKYSSVIAKMHKKHTVGSLVLGKDTFDVTIYPKVDRAFIAVLVVIFFEINKEKDD